MVMTCKSRVEEDSTVWDNLPHGVNFVGNLLLRVFVSI